METTTPFRSPPKKAAFNYKNKHNNQKRERDARKNKGKDTEKTRKGGTRKTMTGPATDRTLDTGTSDDLLLHIGKESSGKDESHPTIALSAGHKDSGPVGGGLPYRDACAVIVLTTSRSAGSQWTA